MSLVAACNAFRFVRHLGDLRKGHRCSDGTNEHAAGEIVKNEMLKSLILLDTKRTFFFLLRPQLRRIHYLMMAPFDPTLWWQLGECVEFRYRIAKLLEQLGS